MGISISQAHQESIQRHGEATYPEECGGLLLGRLEGDRRIVVEVLPLENVRRESRRNRVQLSPLDYLKAEKAAAKQGLGVWGFYHSHPDHPAVPSSYDLEHAPMLDWSYVIVSVREGKAAEMRSWALTPKRDQFIEEEFL